MIEKLHGQLYAREYPYNFKDPTLWPGVFVECAKNLGFNKERISKFIFEQTKAPTAELVIDCLAVCWVFDTP